MRSGLLTAPPYESTCSSDWLNARVGKTQRVADLQLAERLPRSEIGKVLKRTLREQYLQSVTVTD